MHDPSVIEIDLAAIRHNMGVLRGLVGAGCSICPVVKADAYGLGAVGVSRCLVAAGAEILAVYTGPQADELVRSGIRSAILILMPLRDVDPALPLAGALAEGRIHLSAHGPGHVRALAGIARRTRAVVPVHLEIDTGMTRGGCALADAPAALRAIADSDGLRLAGIYTHFASSESDPEQTQRQHDRLDDVLNASRALIGPDCIVHAANTGATLQRRAWHRSMVRVGQAWAGYGPESVRGGALLPGAEALRPSVTWSSRLVHVRGIEEGTRVGYGSTWAAPRRTVLGLVPVGYADGYPHALGRAAAQGGARVEVAVIVDGVRAYAPLVGSVSMDQVTIDLTDVVAGAPSNPAIGTRVELITADREAPNHVAPLAAIAGTNPYELLCRINPRIRRVYRDEVPLVHTVPASARCSDKSPARSVQIPL
ncbi:MAG: alanine racemase [Planctomycetes bacterium]|nr:alanine racemase [Planctomycetota bacterium]